MALKIHEKEFTIPQNQIKLCLQASNLAPKIGHRRPARQLALVRRVSQGKIIVELFDQM